MKNQKGFSLLEITVTLGLVGIIGAIVMNVTGEALKGQKKSNNKMEIHSDLIIQENVFSNLINSLDMRLTFTGPGLPSTSGTYESRFLIPLPQQCRDLSTTNCQNDTSLMFINYKTKNNPSADLTCNFNAPNSIFANPPIYPIPNNYKIFVFDGNLQSYGTSTFSLPLSQITSTGIADLYPSGVIDLNTDAIISVQNGPKSSLWRVIKGLQKLNPLPPFDPLKTLMQMMMGECYSRISMDTNNNVYYLFAVPLKPNHLTQNYSTDLELNSFRLKNVEIMSMGRLDVDKSFGINRCKWDNASAKIICNQDYSFPKLSKVDIVRMDEEFRLPLYPETVIKWYDLGQPCPITADCNIGSEPFLNMPAIPPGLSSQLSPAIYEMPGIPVLLQTEYSYYKQDFLHRIRFRMKQENRRRELFIRFF